MSLICALLLACATETAPAADPVPEPPPPPAPMADVLAVHTAGSNTAFTFSVQIRSPDVDCDQYADWWEIVTPEGALVYRRILGHSHPTEQPFTRDGGPVAVAVGDVVIVRAHLHLVTPRADHPDGYGGVALKGSIKGGFTPVELPPGFGADLAASAPLPDSCLR